MPCTKFEPDISGVCRITGTRPMISLPVNAASMKMYSARNPSIIASPALESLKTETRSTQSTRRKLEDHSPDAVAQHLVVEVDEEPLLEARKLQIRQQLCAMHRHQAPDTFEFDDQFALDQQIHSEAAIEIDSLVSDGHRLFQFRIRNQP